MRNGRATADQAALDSDTVEGGRTEADRIAALLRIRRAEVEQEHRIAAGRLADVQRRLHLIEKENHMSQIEIIEKPLPAIRLAARRMVVADQPEVADAVGPAFDAVSRIIGDERGTLETPVALYEMVQDGLQIIAGYAYTGPPRDGFEIVELPAVENAACGVQLGSMEHTA